ncbi:MAG TPA: ATP-grasp domain-containing protein [Candidatus Obscuribacterales bacterium]
MRKPSNKSWQHWNIAVTGINARVESPGPGCAVARCIREHEQFGGRVIGLGYDVLDAGLYARDFCHSGYLLPYPSAGEDALLDRIIEIHQKEGLDVIIPCLDSEIQNFIRLQDRLSLMGIRMLIPERDQFQLRAKDHLSAFCKKAGVDVPETKCVTDPSFFEYCEEEGWPYPIIVKGIFYDAQIVYNAFDAKAAFSRLVGTWGYPALVQRVIRGDEFNVSAIGDGEGGMMGTVMMRKRGLTDKGKAWAGVTVVDDAVGGVVTKIMRALKWRGPLEVEMMKGLDGNVYLIEINPRFPAWIYLSHSVGRNLPIAVLKLLAGDTDITFAPPAPGTFFIRYAQELIVRLDEFESVFVGGAITSKEDKTAVA